MKIKITIFFALTLSYAATNTTFSQNSPECKLHPPKTEFHFPKEGIVKAEDHYYYDDYILDNDYLSERYNSGTMEILAYIDGPGGSGRYWSIALVIQHFQDDLSQGLYFDASTIGWRTLQKFHALNWLKDIDGDGWPEFTYWSSFTEVKEATGADFGLCGWVYRIDVDKGLLKIDWELSKNLDAEIAAAYRKPLDTKDEWLQNRRNEIAGYLEEFAEGKCKCNDE